MKICPFCNAVFEPFPKNKVYCSHECCSRLHHKNTYVSKRWQGYATCQYCGIEFWSTCKQTKYCSFDCRKASWKRPKTCPQCNQTFTTSTKRQVCCSLRCANLYVFDKCGTRGIHKLSPKICKTCNQPFMGMLQQCYCEKCGHPQIYKDSRWVRASQRFRNENPNCAICGAMAEHVHHTVKHHGDRDKFWDRSTWQSLCAPCHYRLTGKGY